MKIFETTAQMRLAKLTTGQIVRTKNFYTFVDNTTGGGAEYKIIAPRTTDNLVYHLLANGNVAELLSYEGIDIRKAGGKDNNDALNFDNTPIIEALADPVNKVLCPEYGGNNFTPWYFDTIPVTSPDFTIIMGNKNAVQGISRTDAPFRIDAEGGIGGALTAADINGSRIEVVTGVMRADLPQSITLTAVGAVATVLLAGHDYSNGDNYYTEGANETDYNGTFPLGIFNVVAGVSFQYTMGGSPTSPATGTITGRDYTRYNWLDDAVHTPSGIDGSVPMYSTGGQLQFFFNKTYRRAICLSAWPDEEYATVRAMTIGASVATDSATLEMSIDRTIAELIWWNGADWQQGSSTGQSGVTGLIFNSGNLTINHEYCPKVNVTLTPYTVDGTVVPYMPAIRDIDNEFTEINFINTSTEALVTTEDTRMAFMFTKNYTFTTPWNLPELDMYAGNIWVFGLFEAFENPPT